MEVQEIPIKKLYHHPDNPRSGYGDVQELAESIKEQGILQPLTVVRISTGYNVVAGNRRLEAAKAAGLDTCPCIVSEMDDKTQAAVILVENMQRKNLNLYEESRGIQLCLDLGMDEKELAKKTGLSKETIRHRKKMSELDQEQLKEKCEDGQITLQMLINLEKVKDKEKRNEILNYAGSNEFGWKLNNAIHDEEVEELRQRAYEILTSFAEEMPDDWADSHYIQTHYSITGDIDIPDDADTSEYAFRRSWSGASRYNLYRLKDGTEEEDETKEDEGLSERQKQDESKAKLKDLGEQLFKMRKEHMKHADHFSGNILQWMGYCICGDEFDDENAKPEGFPWNESIYQYGFEDVYHEIMGNIGSKTDEAIIMDMGMDRLNNPIAAPILCYSVLETKDRISCARWTGEYDEDDQQYDRLYAFLKLCGYQLSETEKQILDGTHEYYYREEE